MRALVLAAVRTAQAQAESATASADAKTLTPIGVLENIILGRFDSEIQNGKTLVSTNEAGGSASFTLMYDLTPSDIMELSMEAITWINSQPDPSNPDVYPARRIKRLRASFAKATI